ncbi:Xaa-Pro peptidase family protein [Bacillus sp. JJ1503]|uniref:M24 family metallopeptidase n=1 Tax=Bacillus sp. JJ1503 TaxID=3122956 RepID=UPI002FFF1006
MNYQERRHKLIHSLKAVEIEDVLIQDLDHIYYYTGFYAAVLSRPFGLVMSGQKAVLIVPATAADSAKLEAQGVDIEIYYEHPVEGDKSLNFHASLDQAISSLAQGKLIGVEANKLTLSELNILSSRGLEVKDISTQLSQLRSVKEIDEIEAIRLSGKYVDYINQRTLAFVRPEISEIELEQLGANALRQEVAKNLPQASVTTFIMTTSGTERTVLPHTNSSIRPLQPGDSFILCRQVAINGYRAQCDRMGFVGEPSKEQKDYYSIVLRAHAAALEAIRPGIIASDVDKAIRNVFQQEGVDQYFVHRSGSGIGISMGESPFLRFDSQEILAENMTLIIQPALYIPGVGGFRCSDTVLVQEDGCELITHYPRDIESLTLV